MRRNTARTAATWVIAVGLVGVVGTATATAANGKPALLGQTNKATAPTKIVNNGSGAALSLVTDKPGTPPLSVSNSTKVSKLNADALDGLSANAFQPAYKRVFVVHPQSTATASGTVLRNTVNGIVADAAHPALVFIEPGVYALGDTELTMDPYVDIRGSGPDVTRVVVNRTTGTIQSAVNGADPTTLADLAVTLQGNGTDVAAYRAIGGDARLRNVDITVSSSGTLGPAAVMATEAKLTVDESRVSVAVGDFAVPRGALVTNGDPLSAPTIEFRDGWIMADPYAWAAAGNILIVSGRVPTNSENFQDGGTQGIVMCKVSMYDNFSPVPENCGATQS